MVFNRQNRLVICMASSSPKKRRRVPVEPVLPDTPIPTGNAGEPPRYCEMRAEDGTLRPARFMSRGEREKGQVVSDFFGILPAMSLDANVRGVDSVLVSLLEKLDISAAEFAPEVLADAWRKAAGNFLSTRAELLTIADKKARIRTAHPAVRYELNQRKSQIIKALNAVLGEGCVTGVQIIHG